MKKVLVITLKGDHKYQFGIDKNVKDVLGEINYRLAGKDEFYFPVDTCAIRVNEIVSVEQFEYDPNGGKEN